MKRFSISFLLLLALTGWAVTPEEIIDIKERAENGKAEAQKLSEEMIKANPKLLGED